jgi:DNA-binding transcriptional MocR family regulator
MAGALHSQSSENGLNEQANENLAELLAVLDGWTTGRGPLYRRLANALRAAIRRGDLPSGFRLPAERLLAERLLISRSTVVAAYDQVRQEDLLDRRQGSGTRVRGMTASHRPTERAAGLNRALGRNTLFRRITEGPDEAIDLVGAYLLDSGGLPAQALKGVEREVATLSSTAGYAPLGYPPLRQAIAEHVTGLGLPTVPEQILVTSGAQQAIYLAACLYLQTGDSVVVENPSYPGALDAFSTLGARLAWVATGRSGADVEAIADLASRIGPRLVYLIPTYQNPIGSVMPEPRRRQLARLIEDRDLPTIDDQSLAALGLGTMPPLPIASFALEAPVLTIDSVSKIGWGGLRVGWIRAPDQVVARLGRIKAVADLGGSLPSQVIARRLLESFEDVQRTRLRLLAERFELMSALLARWLPAWSWDRPQGGLCLWVRLPHGSATEFAQVALRHGVSVVPGPVASADGSFGDCLRLPFGQTAAALQEGVQRLAAAWDAYVPLQQPRQHTLAVIV